VIVLVLVAVDEDVDEYEDGNLRRNPGKHIRHLSTGAGYP
jgi:hypothetical protein